MILQITVINRLKDLIRLGDDFIMTKEEKIKDLLDYIVKQEENKNEEICCGCSGCSYADYGDSQCYSCEFFDYFYGED